MFPIMRELDKKKVPYTLIDAGQHPKIMEKLYKLFSIKKPDYYFYNIKKDITNIKEILKWSFVNLLQIRKHKKILNKKNGLCIVHGDAPPAFLGMLIGKLCKQRIVHVEAGKRTYKIKDPFPEELIRRIVDKHSYLNFASNEKAYKNLQKEKSKGIIINTKFNTVFDVVKIALAQDISFPKHKYVLVSIHRFETIANKKRLKFIVDLLKKISKTNKLIITLHDSTKEALINKNLYEDLEKNTNITISPLQDYFTFIHLINNCEYLITDGGGPEEESAILGKPCLLLRKFTEEGDYNNVCVAGFNKTIIETFLKNPQKYKTNPLEITWSPSKIIVDNIIKHLN